MNQRRILVTSALPYANGHIHIGHLVEYIQTDIWVRFQKLRGHDCRYMCADDTHGTAIMIRAQKEGRSEEALIAEMSEAHQRDFAGFHIEFDNYGSTNSENSKKHCSPIWQALRDKGLVKENEIEQLFDVEANTFLADRFVKGTCPKCKAVNQNGDSCDVCGAVYTPAELIDPVSILSGTTPEVRKAVHLFVEIESLHEFLNDWTQNSGALQKEISNYLKGHFLGEPLHDWDISRPAPYFGFEIPDAPGNYWYVWFDAPIGYIGSTQDWCDANNQDIKDWWWSEDCEIHHFIGKDITYFHTLFWPAMLKSAGIQLPTKVHIHGFLNVNGEKMSKSKGTFVQAATYLEHLNPSYLRYYYASKLTNKVDDLDLNLEEFVNKINSDLVGKLVNLASRTAKFIKDVGLSATYPDDDGLFADTASAGDEIAEAYEECDFNKAMRLLMAAADKANEFVERSAPWKLKKEADKQQELQDCCTIALNLFRQLVVYISPVLPVLAAQVDELFGKAIKHWDDSKEQQVGYQLNEFKHLMQRVDPKAVEAMINDSKSADEEIAEKQDAADDDGSALEAEPLAETCTFDDFMKVDLRVARVVNAEEVKKSKKLLKLTLSLGGDNTRTVLAGIKTAYTPEQLIGRLVVMVANLAPREMGKFGTSEGMVIAAGPGGEDIWLLSPDSGAKPGQRVH